MNEMMQHFDGTVDFSKFDNDKDGKVEAVSIVYAGGMNQTRNGVKLLRYMMTDLGWIEVVDVDRNMNAFLKTAANSAVGYRFTNPARPQESFFWSNLKNDGKRAAWKGFHPGGFYDAKGARLPLRSVSARKRS